MMYAEVYGNRIKNLHAKLRFCYNVIFEKADSVIASATNSHLRVDTVDYLELGKHKLAAEPYANKHYTNWLPNNSSMNLYRFKKLSNLKVFDSATDDFKIGQVEHLEVNKFMFSNYTISKFGVSLNFDGKHGDIFIDKLDSNFETIDIKNAMSQIKINMLENRRVYMNVLNPKSSDLQFSADVLAVIHEEESRSVLQLGSGPEGGIIDIQCDKCELSILKE